MALIPCKECNNNISRSAEVCPHCGFNHGKARKEKSSMTQALLLAIVLLLFLALQKYGIIDISQMLKNILGK